MSLDQFRQVVSSAEELAELIGMPSELVIRKQLAELDDHMMAFVGRAPFVLLGTVGRKGTCDVSPRGDPGAVASVLNSSTLVLPERPGNRRADSLRNIIETGRVGLLFLVPGVGETLRINGAACVTRDEEVLATLAINGKKPVVGIGVSVEECYFQCAKALLRSKLWQYAGGDAGSAPFDFAEVLVKETGMEGQSVEALREQIEASYRDRLF